ncbi:hypothetical protein IVB52_17520 [Bradyrhizobium sp. CW11]|nr:hypothetical protein [Bradyrhizobium sp. CW11]
MLLAALENASSQPLLDQPQDDATIGDPARYHPQQPLVEGAYVGIEHPVHMPTHDHRRMQSIKRTCEEIAPAEAVGEPVKVDF